VIIVLYQASFSITKDNKGIAAVPQHTSIPAPLAEDVTTCVYPTPGQGKQI
jgi:hypothetical protein